MKLFNLVTDLTGLDDEDGLDLAQDLMERQPGERPLKWFLVVRENGLLATELGGSDATLVTVAPTTTPLHRWSAGIQATGDGQIVLIPTAADALEITELDCEHIVNEKTVLAFHPQASAFGGMPRYVAFEKSSYTAVRGINLFDKSEANALQHLTQRITWASEGSGTIINAPDIASTPLNTTGVMVANLPVWKYRPPASGPLVTVVVSVDNLEYEDDCIDAIKAQTFDDLEIVVIDKTRSQQVEEWVNRNQREYPRFGIMDDLAYVAIGPHTRSIEDLIARLRGTYYMFIDSADMLVPWAIESALRRLRVGASGVTGRRVNYSDKNNHEISPKASPWYESIPLIRSHIANSLMRDSGPTNLGTWANFRSRLGGLEQTRVAFALSSRQSKDTKATQGWLLGTNKQGKPNDLRPYLPDRCVQKYMVLNKYCVGKIEELDAYDRVIGVVTSYLGDGSMQAETAVIGNIGYADMARLGRLGIGNEVFAEGAGLSAEGYMGDIFTTAMDEILGNAGEGACVKIANATAVGRDTTIDPEEDLQTLRATQGWVTLTKQNSEKPLILSWAISTTSPMTVERGTIVLSRTSTFQGVA